MIRRTIARVLPLLLCSALPALAGSLPEYSMVGGDRARDLTFPTQISDIEFESTPRLALYKPDGEGPFPGLVLMHQCGGLNNNMSMLNWAREGVKRGYVVLLMDALGPRNVNSVCYSPKGDVFFSRGARDALQAAKHLRSLPYVDKTRLAYAGFSWGGGVGLVVSSKRSKEVFGLFDKIENFNAVVSFYPPCNVYPKNGSAPYTLVLSGNERPLLVLLGGRDNETPPEECTADLSPMKAAGRQIEWHLYPDATHCWDCEQWNGLSKTDIRGNRVEYLYDEAVTRDSGRRMFEFIEKAFKQGR